MSTPTLEREQEEYLLPADNGPELFARKVNDTETTDIETSLDTPVDPSMTLQELPLATIEPSQDNPRTLFEQEALESLALSIKQFGILQPIVVRRREDYQAGDLVRYTIIAGDRRHRAAKIAGLTTIRALVKEGFVSDRSALVLTLIENLQREQLNAMEAAAGYQQLRDLGYHLSRIAQECGVSEEVVSNTIRLLKLPAEVQVLISAGKLSRSHGLLLLPVLVRLGQMHSVRTEQEAPVIQAAQECAEQQWSIKRLTSEIDLRFPRSKEATLPLDLPEGAQQGGFTPPGPSTAGLNSNGDNQSSSSSVALPTTHHEIAQEDSDESLHDHPAEDSDPEPSAAQEADPEETDAGETGDEEEDAISGSPAAQRKDAPVGYSDAPKPPATADASAAPAAEKVVPPKAADAPKSTPSAQAAGTVSHIVLLSQEADDWLWEQDLTPLSAIELLKNIWPLRLTVQAEYAAKALTRQFNDEHPEGIVTIAERIEAVLIEAVLVVRAGDAGLMPNDNYKNLDDYKSIDDHKENE